jgi:hypothetical protein
MTYVRRTSAAIHFKIVASTSSKPAGSNRVACGSTRGERAIAETTVFEREIILIVFLSTMGMCFAQKSVITSSAR